MTTKEVRTFMERVKSHYQEFIIDDFKLSEWYGKLKDYDAADVNKKLDEHLNSEEYGDSIPKIYFMTKYLTPTKDKGKIRHYTIYCTKCCYEIPDTEFEHHTKRCYEASTIVRDFKRYFNQSLQKEKLMNLNENKFEEIYQKYLDRMLSSDKVETFRKKILIHIKYPEYSFDDIEEIVKEIVGKDNE